jgi:cyclopropane-fatty-acyl-phospholipid synthase
MSVTQLAIRLSEQGRLPDEVIRAGIRRLLQRRLAEIDAGDVERQARRIERFVASMDQAEVAPLAQLANAQHYEVPAEFFVEVLGPRRKYSCCFWAPECTSLADAEDAALRVTCERAEIADGQRILELGCGWGSLSLWIAERFHRSQVTAISNSAPQRRFIEAQATASGLNNLSVITSDMNAFVPDAQYDRVVSVEMFEHMRNWRRLFGRVHDALVPGGRFFMHVFCHRTVPYAFEAVGDDDWMSRHFFSGGMMPSDELPLRFQDRLRFLQRWRWDGRHYEKTANAWLANQDRSLAKLRPILEATYGPSDARMWQQRWRIFFMSCAELFAHAQGQEWGVSHYLFERPAR